MGVEAVEGVTGMTGITGVAGVMGWAIEGKETVGERKSKKRRRNSCKLCRPKKSKTVQV